VQPTSSFPWRSILSGPLENSLWTSKIDHLLWPRPSRCPLSATFLQVIIPRSTILYGPSQLSAAALPQVSSFQEAPFSLAHFNTSSYHSKKYYQNKCFLSKDSHSLLTTSTFQSLFSVLQPCLPNDPNSQPFLS